VAALGPVSSPACIKHDKEDDNSCMKKLRGGSHFYDIIRGVDGLVYRATVLRSALGATELMQRQVRVWSLACSLVLVSFIFGLAPVLARGNDSQADLPPSQLTGVRLANDGSLTLVDDATLPPPAVSGFARWGVFIAPAQLLDRPVTRLRLDYNAVVPAGCAALIDVRGSADGQRWSAWHIERAAGAEVAFDQPVRWVQYRAKARWYARLCLPR
jgi:hypothetical protein